MGVKAGVIALVLLAVALVLIMVPAAPVQAQEESADGGPICVGCHQYVSTEVAETWATQNHGRNGVECAVCHSTHEEGIQPNPTARVCFGCHDVDEIHPDFTGETPGERCMECHTSNVHRMPGEGSWFQGGLSREKLESSQKPESAFSEGAGRYAGIAVVILAAVVGLIFGFIMDRFVRNL